MKTTKYYITLGEICNTLRGVWRTGFKEVIGWSINRPF